MGKLENALNECRILVLVAQVMIGFQYQSIFQDGFARLPFLSQCIKLGGLGLMLVSLALLLSPAAHQLIVERGNASARLYKYITRVTMPALLPFGIGIGADFYVVGEHLWGIRTGVASAILSVIVALFFWYGIEWVALAGGRPPRNGSNTEMDEMTSLDDKIKFVLMDTRVVLPGAQALLGFQFASVFTNSFDRLASVSKGVHFAGLACIGFSTILLMAPAAFHRIVERGENTERLHTFAGRTVLSAMAMLACGIALDVYVVVQKTLKSSVWALSCGFMTLAIFLAAWFGLATLRRHTNDRLPHQGIQ